MRSTFLLAVLPAFCMACDLLPAQMPSNDQSEWTTSAGPTDSSDTTEPAVTTASASDDSTPTTSATALGTRLVVLPDGTTTVGLPLGSDVGPGPVLVAPVTGGPPEVGLPLD